ncbi:MAG: cytochrome c biogenesis protein CcdA [Nitrospirae bacterium]|nr:cytochrome c biogenesis protein CcdA [Nitrospirota bacterium]
MDQNISLFIAFSAGLLSFISPCVLPLIPSYVSYITGLSFRELTGENDRSRIRIITIKHSLLFIAGFSTIFILLGASASFVGKVLLDYQNVIRKVGGVLIFLFGLYIMGLLRWNFLGREAKIRLSRKPRGLWGSYLVGNTFAVGWTPCVGPILGTILFYAGTTGSISSGIRLLTAYSLGLGLPLFITSLAINSLLIYFKKVQRHMRLVQVVSGIFLLVVGVLIFTNYFSILSSYLQAWGVGWMS